MEEVLEKKIEELEKRIKELERRVLPPTCNKCNNLTFNSTYKCDYCGTEAFCQCCALKEGWFFCDQTYQTICNNCLRK